MPEAVDVARVQARIGADVSGLASGLGQARASVQQFARATQQQLQQTTGSFRNIAQSIRSSFSGAIPESLPGMIDLEVGLSRVKGTFEAAFRPAVQSLAGFEKEVRNVTTVVQEIPAEKIYGALVKLSEDPRVYHGPQELAKALYDVVSAGVPYDQAMDLLRKASEAAMAGQSDLTTTVNVLTAALNSHIPGVRNAQEAADVLFQTVQVGDVHFQELAATLGEALPLAKSVGMSLQEVGAYIAMVTNRGISAAEATTALRNIIQQLSKPGEEAVKVFEELGIAHGTAAVKAAGVKTVLQQLAQAYKENSDRLAQLFPDIRGYQGILEIAEDTTGEWERKLRELADSEGAAGRAAELASRSIDASWMKVRKSVEAAVLKIGESYVPSLKALAESVNNSVQAFSQLPTPVQKSLVNLSLFVGTATVLLSALGAIIGVLKNLGLIVPELIKSVRALVFVVRLLATAFTTLGRATPLGLITMAATVLGFLGYKLYKLHEQSKSAASEMSALGVSVKKTNDQVKEGTKVMAQYAASAQHLQDIREQFLKGPSLTLPPAPTLGSLPKQRPKLGDGGLKLAPSGVLFPESMPEWRRRMLEVTPKALPAKPVPAIPVKPVAKGPGPLPEPIISLYPEEVRLSAVQRRMSEIRKRLTPEASRVIAALKSGSAEAERLFYKLPEKQREYVTEFRSLSDEEANILQRRSEEIKRRAEEERRKLEERNQAIAKSQRELQEVWRAIQAPGRDAYAMISAYRAWLEKQSLLATGIANMHEQLLKLARERKAAVEAADARRVAEAEAKISQLVRDIASRMSQLPEHQQELVSEILRTRAAFREAEEERRNQILETELAELKRENEIGELRVRSAMESLKTDYQRLQVFTKLVDKYREWAEITKGTSLEVTMLQRVQELEGEIASIRERERESLKNLADLESDREVSRLLEKKHFEEALSLLRQRRDQIRSEIEALRGIEGAASDILSKTQELYQLEDKIKEVLDQQLEPLRNFAAQIDDAVKEVQRVKEFRVGLQIDLLPAEEREIAQIREREAQRLGRIYSELAPEAQEYIERNFVQPYREFLAEAAREDVKLFLEKPFELTGEAARLARLARAVFKRDLEELGEAQVAALKERFDEIEARLNQFERRSRLKDFWRSMAENAKRSFQELWTSFFTSWISGEASLKSAFKNLITGLRQLLARAVAEILVEKLKRVLSDIFGPKGGAESAVRNVKVAGDQVAAAIAGVAAIFHQGKLTLGSALKALAAAMATQWGAKKGGFLGALATVAGAVIPFLQKGGPVRPGRAYIVGEAGPELFIPRQPGYVTPTMGTVINVQAHFYGDLHKDVDVERIGRELAKQISLSRRVMV